MFVGGYVFAQFILLIVFMVFDVDVVIEWGWCIGFFIGGVVVLVVFWLCCSMDELFSENYFMV